MFYHFAQLFQSVSGLQYRIIHLHSSTPFLDTRDLRNKSKNKKIAQQNIGQENKLNMTDKPDYQY